MITASRSQIQKVIAQVEPLKVWLRPTGTTCKVRIHRAEDGSLLREELLAHAYECGKVLPIAGTEQAQMIVRLENGKSAQDLERWVGSLGNVTLMLDPA